jgi:lysyl-tRNA synthetase, class I
MHWADVVAKRLVERRQDHVLATAITPSGPIHVGNMREVLTTEAVHRALLDAGADSDLIYIADSYDPLRKVYKFLDPGDYADYVGRPLAEIPPPDGSGKIDEAGTHGTYAEHFLEPFLEALEHTGVKLRVLDAYTMYQEGHYKETILTALDHTNQLREIIEKVSKRQLPKDWAPFTVQCQQCKRLSSTTPLLYDRPVLTYRCECGIEADVDVTTPGAGKLPWRIDWPARWSFLGVTFEAAGKDHHAAGGSWDTGKAIAKKVFQIDPPMGLQYEFIHLKGAGTMHSSTGTGVPAQAMLSVTPPEVLRFLIMRTDPKKHIVFDPGLGILSLVDQYDRFERVAYGVEEAQLGVKDADRVHALSQPGEVASKPGVQVPYRHLVTVVQMAEDDEEVLAILRRAGELPDELEAQDRAKLLERAACVRAWLRTFAPEDVKFRVQRTVPEIEVDERARRYYQELLAALDGLGTGSWTGAGIHDRIYNTAKAMEVEAKDAFAWIYQAFLGQEKGPRAGHFLASMDPGFVRERLEVLAGPRAAKAREDAS